MQSTKAIKILLGEQEKIPAAERNNTSYMTSDLLDDDREYVAGMMMTLLPALDTTNLEEAWGTNDRPKGGRPKSASSKKSRHLSFVATAFMSEVAAKYDDEKLEDDDLMK